MTRKGSWLLGAAAGAIAIAGAAAASETTTYTYDALGRLVAVSTGGGPNNGLNVGTCYDRAGNRSTYNVATAGGAPPACGAPPASPPPPPPPPPPTPPPPANQPPVANGDYLTAPKCAVRSVNVIANDTDPDGNVPLTLTAVNGPSAQIESSTNISLETPSTNGTYTIAYTVTDALGASAGGILTVTVSGSQQCQ